MKPTLKSLSVVSAITLLAGCQDQQHAAAPAPRPVLSVVATPQSLRTVGFAGTVQPRYKSDLGFRVLGRVMSRKVSVGDIVKKGQLLATLDPILYQLAVGAAQAALASAAARLENASATETRQRTLLQQSVANQAQYDTARESFESAQARVISARADLDKSKEQLGDTELHADFDGVVTATEAQPGQVVQVGQTVVTVARPDVREAVLDVPESIGRQLKLEARFDIALQVDPSVQAAGMLREVAPQADPTTRTLRVRVTLEKPPEDFRLGTTITAMVPTQTAPEIELPVSALIEQEGRTMVWIVDPATATVSTRDLKVAARDGSTVRVLDGLTRGMRVVTAGVNSLTIGQAVKIPDEVSQ